MREFEAYLDGYFIATYSAANLAEAKATAERKWGAFIHVIPLGKDENKNKLLRIIACGADTLQKIYADSPFTQGETFNQLWVLKKQKIITSQEGNWFVV